MNLILDIGNSQLFGGLFIDEKLSLRFRKISTVGASSDELGLFLRSVIRENGFNPDDVREVACCSVVPEMNHSMANSIRKYFDREPFFLKAGVRTGLQIKYRNPLEVGADRIANSIAAYHLFPGKNCLVVDFGTATTFDAVTSDKKYLGGAILPGLKISMQALEAKTSRLPTVEIVKVHDVCGRSTVESIQSGLYFGHIGMVREMEKRFTEGPFEGSAPLMIATGGFSRLFEDSQLFDYIMPDFVLEGIYYALQLNIKEEV